MDVSERRNARLLAVHRAAWLVFAVWILLPAPVFAQALPLIGSHGPVPIVTASSPTIPEEFAASELARYLGKIAGARFGVVTSVSAGSPALIVGRRAVEAIAGEAIPRNLGNDGYILRTQGNRVLIAGLSDRGTLYGVYALLEKLGCRWFAPNFDFYGAAKGEEIPHNVAPSLAPLDDVERPAFRWRKLYIEEGRSHTARNLVEMVDWMAKARMNILDCPADYQHEGRTQWDNWRKVLIPELRKRGLLIEVGGHGYQTYLPPETYFAQHPDWFGMHDGQRSDQDFEVFATSNQQAVHMLVANIARYLAVHPEIDIFDLWPPDGARWSEAKPDVALGSPPERQMLLLNEVARELAPRFPHLRLQFIAYQTYTAPPITHKPGPDILMEFCPINRSFESALYEGATLQNEVYFHDLERWRDGVIDPQNITIYTYITKYAWRSLPITIPHLIVDEVRRYHEMGLGGMATYSEPGSWATFELDHYVTAQALWNPNLDVARMLNDYTSRRYGPAGKFVRQYLRLLEDVVAHAVPIPGTDLDAGKEKMLIEQFGAAPHLLKQAHAAAGNHEPLLILLAKLEHSCRYVSNAMALEQVRLDGGSQQSPAEKSQMQELLEQRTKILADDPDDGVILRGGRVP